MKAPIRPVSLVAVVVMAIAGLTGCSSSGAAAPAGTSSMADTMSMAAPGDQAGTPTGSTSHLVDPATFATAIAARGTVTIDVHVPFEGRIAGTDLMIPYTDIAQQASKLPVDHRTELAIYCRTGVMSAIAARTLASLGYTDVVELHGGMYAWEASGRTLLSTP